MSDLSHSEETALLEEPQGPPKRRFRAHEHFARCGALLRGGLRVLGAHARDVALPPLCASCREPVSGEGLCPQCWSKLAFISRPYCERLGIPFAYDPGPGFLSMEAIAAPPAYGRARAAVRYDDISGALVKSLKYYDRLDLVPIMGRWLAGAGGDLLTGADAIVPVPLHWRRLWARRFNQSAALAGEIARISGVAILHDALARRKPTPQQVGLTRAERATNVQGAFAVSAAGKMKIAGKKLVLVDDVLTSGATAEACARALLRAGAGNVDVLVFARVVEAARTPI
jgi:ComF family protein